MIACRELAIPPNLDILYVEQEAEADDSTAVEAVLKADTKRTELLKREKELQAILDSEENDHNENQEAIVGLAVFGEVFCSVGFIFGAFYRLAMIPMVFTMGMAFFVIHGNDPFAVKELAFIYLVVFVLMYITGPGKFSIDHVISSALYKKKR